MMVGPIFSRPLVQSLHASVSIGFLVVATLLSLLLPKEKENSEKLCQYLKNPEAGDKSMANVSESDVTIELEPSSEWPVLVIPCFIIGTWIFVTGLGFLILGLRNLVLPKHHQQNVSKKLEDASEDIKVE